MKIAGPILGMVTGIGIGIGACSTPSHKEHPVMNTSNTSNTPNTPTEDEQMIARLREAVTAPVVPETLEATIGHKALVNTSTGFPLDGLRRVNLIPDPDHPNETLSLETAQAVIYWARPVPGDDPHIVGVQVRKDGTAAVFFGIVQPP